MTVPANLRLTDRRILKDRSRAEEDLSWAEADQSWAEANKNQELIHPQINISP